MDLDFSHMAATDQAASIDGRNAKLDAYLDWVRETLRRRGYVVAHGHDYALYREAPDHPSLPTQMRNHFDFAAKHRKDLVEVQKSVLSNIDGYAFFHDKFVLVPDEAGIVDRLAAQEHFDPEALKRRGITDQYLYAYILLHEVAAHVFGETKNEYSASLQGMLHFIKGSGLDRNGPVVSFFNSYFSLQALIEPLKQRTDKTTHGYTDVALHAAVAEIPDLDALWQYETGGHFRPEAKHGFERFGKRESANADDRAFAMARHKMQEVYKSGSSDSVLQRAAFKLMNHKEDKTTAMVWFRAAQALLSYDRALDNLIPLCRPGAPILKDFHQLLTPDKRPAPSGQREAGL